MKTPVTAVLFLTGAVAASLLGVVYARSVHADAAKDRARAIETATDPAEKVAALADAILQPRFQIVDGRRFGISRVITVSGHENVARFLAEGDAEKPLFAALKAQDRPLAIGFLHMGHELGYKPQPTADGGPARTLPAETIEKARQQYRDVKPYGSLVHVGRDTSGAMLAGAHNDLAKSWAPLAEKAKAGTTTRLRAGEFDVFVRPVKSESATCQGCHAGTKLGDTLGALVYYVGKAKTPASGT